MLATFFYKHLNLKNDKMYVFLAFFSYKFVFDKIIKAIKNKKKLFRYTFKYYRNDSPDSFLK